jgi:Predicted hydrolase of the alpha/beta superfamily
MRLLRTWWALVPALGIALTAAPLRAQTAAIAPPPAPDAIPRHDAFTLDSRALGERRTINVYTPPAYAASTGGSFPVLYMPDGGLAEDFPHVANTIDSLIALGRIRPVIVVGIENTQRRRDLTGPTRVASDSTIAPKVGGSAVFRRFVREELMPEVRRRYRCSGQTSIVGNRWRASSWSRPSCSSRSSSTATSRSARAYGGTAARSSAPPARAAIARRGRSGSSS